MKPKTPPGFTTLELLITLTLVALLAAAIANGLGIGRQAWRAGRAVEAKWELETTAQALEHLIERTIAVAAPREAARAPMLVFAGTPHALDFVFLSNGEGQWAGPIRAHLGVKAEAQGRIALVTTAYRSSTAWAMVRADTADLLGDDVELTFSFFGALEPGNEAIWRADWVGASKLPRLVKATLTRKTPQRPEKIEIVVRLPAS